jgi:hypothetical protein
MAFDGVAIFNCFFGYGGADACELRVVRRAVRSPERDCSPPAAGRHCAHAGRVLTMDPSLFTLLRLRHYLDVAVSRGACFIAYDACAVYACISMDAGCDAAWDFRAGAVWRAAV